MRQFVASIVTLVLLSGCVTDKGVTPGPEVKPVETPMASELPKTELKESIPVKEPAVEEPVKESKILEEKKTEVPDPVETAQPEEMKIEESVKSTGSEPLKTTLPESPEGKTEEVKVLAPLEAPKWGSVTGMVTVAGKEGEKQDAGHVLVSLEPFDSALIPEREPKVFKVGMENKVYVPADLVVRVGDQVVFDNLDSFRHNVFSLSEENKFDLGTYGAGERPGVTFQKAGVVKVYCNIHPDMAAFVLVGRTDWSAVTDETGRFKVEGLPAGEYVLKAWSLRAELEKQVTVRAGEEIPLLLELDASKYQPAPHMNKFGKEYPRNFSDDESY